MCIESKIENALIQSSLGLYRAEVTDVKFLPNNMVVMYETIPVEGGVPTIRVAIVGYDYRVHNDIFAELR